MLGQTTSASLDEIMIGPPGIPKLGRRIFSSRVAKSARVHRRQDGWRWLAGLYLAGVLAHFSHHMAFDLADPSFGDALISAPTSLVWPADLIETLMDMS
jgi:hypothetical protein